MAELIARTPLADLLPLTHGRLVLTETPVNRLMSVAPHKGQKTALSAALKQAVGTPLPAINRRKGPIIWAGHGVWMVAADIEVAGLAAVTDQSDAWAVAALSGAGAEDVLARLVPVDLRASQFKVGHVAHTMLGHMSVIISRTGAQTFEIMVMRSMAATLVHDLDVAMRAVQLRV